MVVKVGATAPNLQISEWVQGKPTNIDKEKGNIVLVEVFQVNCPGCFMYGIPQAIDVYEKFHNSGVTVLGMATAFEDYDKNTLANLEKLLTTGEVIGETLHALSQYRQLRAGNKIPFKIPFPVAMDLLKRESADLADSKILDFIEANVPEFRSYSEKDKQILKERVKHYLANKEFSAKTFEEYSLRGTPSSIVIDRKGNLRHVFFGAGEHLEGVLQEMLRE